MRPTRHHDHFIFKQFHKDKYTFLFFSSERLTTIDDKIKLFANGRLQNLGISLFSNISIVDLDSKFLLGILFNIDVKKIS
jgi:hypothetical protein